MKSALRITQGKLAIKADSNNAAGFIIKTTIIISKTQFKTDNNVKRDL
jgi:hypothetical protein